MHAGHILRHIMNIHNYYVMPVCMHVLYDNLRMWVPTNPFLMQESWYTYIYYSIYRILIRAWSNDQCPVWWMVKSPRKTSKHECAKISRITLTIWNKAAGQNARDLNDQWQCPKESLKPSLRVHHARYLMRKSLLHIQPIERIIGLALWFKGSNA